MWASWEAHKQTLAHHEQFSAAAPPARSCVPTNKSWQCWRVKKPMRDLVFASALVTPTGSLGVLCKWGLLEGWHEPQQVSAPLSEHPRWQVKRAAGKSMCHPPKANQGTVSCFKVWQRGWIYITDICKSILPHQYTPLRHPQWHSSKDNDVNFPIHVYLVSMTDIHNYSWIWNINFEGRRKN